MTRDGKAKIAVLGAGWWGVEVYIPALLDNPDVDLVAVNRRNREALDKITGRFGIAKGYTDYRELLAAEDLGPDNLSILVMRVGPWLSDDDQVKEMALAGDSIGAARQRREGRRHGFIESRPIGSFGVHLRGQAFKHGTSIACALVRAVVDPVKKKPPASLCRPFRARPGNARCSRPLRLKS